MKRKALIEQQVNRCVDTVGRNTTAWNLAQARTTCTKKSSRCQISYSERRWKLQRDYNYVLHMSVLSIFYPFAIALSLIEKEGICRGRLADRTNLGFSVFIKCEAVLGNDWDI